MAVDRDGIPRLLAVGSLASLLHLARTLVPGKQQARFRHFSTEPRLPALIQHANSGGANRRRSVV